MSDPIITVEHARRVFEGGRIVALDDATLTIDRGEFVAIVGPSGSGKSTLLNLLGALDVADAGRVVVDGVDLGAEADLASFRRRTVGFVFQLHNLIPSLTAWENVQMPLLEEPGRPRERRARAVALLEGLGLGERVRSLPTKLSGGERQRVAIARALVCDPDVLIADEPTGSVDSATSRSIIALLRRINRERGTTVVLVTHDPEVAKEADRTIQMLDGRTVAPAGSVHGGCAGDGGREEARRPAPDVVASRGV